MGHICHARTGTGRYRRPAPSIQQTSEASGFILPDYTTLLSIGRERTDPQGAPSRLAAAHEQAAAALPLTQFLVRRSEPCFRVSHPLDRFRLDSRQGSRPPVPLLHDAQAAALFLQSARRNGSGHHHRGTVARIGGRGDGDARGRRAARRRGRNNNRRRGRHRNALARRDVDDNSGSGHADRRRGNARAHQGRRRGGSDDTRASIRHEWRGWAHLLVPITPRYRSRVLRNRADVVFDARQNDVRPGLNAGVFPQWRGLRARAGSRVLCNNCIGVWQARAARRRGGDRPGRASTARHDGRDGRVVAAAACHQNEGKACRDDETAGRDANRRGPQQGAHLIRKRRARIRSPRDTFAQAGRNRDANRGPGDHRLRQLQKRQFVRAARAAGGKVRGNLLRLGRSRFRVHVNRKQRLNQRARGIARRSRGGGRRGRRGHEQRHCVSGGSLLPFGRRAPVNRFGNLARLRYTSRLSGGPRTGVKSSHGSTRFFF